MKTLCESDVYNTKGAIVEESGSPISSVTGTDIIGNQPHLLRELYFAFFLLNLMVQQKIQRRNLVKNKESRNFVVVNVLKSSHYENSCDSDK